MLHEQIKQARIDRGLNQSELCRLAKLEAQIQAKTNEE
jgi:hypothetical protein